MASYLPPKDSFDSDELDGIELAFNNVWATIVANEPFRDTARDGALKQSIYHKLFALAQAGVVDADVLASLALQISSFSWICNGHAQLVVVEDSSPNDDRSSIKS